MCWWVLLTETSKRCKSRGRVRENLGECDDESQMRPIPVGSRGIIV